MNYGFLTERGIFYAYRIVVQGQQVATGDGTCEVTIGSGGLSEVVGRIKSLIKDSAAVDLPRLNSESLGVDIISLNRI